MLRDIKYIVKNFIQGVINLIRYRKIVWYDRDWDFSFMLQLLVFKLSNMAEYMEKKGIAADKAQIVKELRELSALIELLDDDMFFQQFSTLDATKCNLMADKEREKVEERIVELLANYRTWWD